MNTATFPEYQSLAAESLPGYVNMLVYGGIGVGKTVLGATGPAPILYLDLDDGLLSVRRPRPELVAELGIPVNEIYQERITGWDQFVSAVKKVKNRSRLPGFFKTVVLDNITTAQIFCLQKHIGVDGMTVDRLPERTDWNIVLQQMRAMTLLIRDLPCHTLFIAHEQLRNGMYGPLIQGMAREQIPGLVDLMCRYTLYDVEEDDGKGGKTPRQVRALNFHKTMPVTGVSSGIDAKNRGGWLSKLEYPHLGRLIEKLYPSKEVEKETEKGKP